jgi:hypothetical protein
MPITLRRQIACYTDLTAILALVDPCPRGVPRPSFVLPSGRTAQATQSLRAFRLKGTRCAECGLRGHHFLEFRTEQKGLSGLCLTEPWVVDEERQLQAYGFLCESLDVAGWSGLSLAEHLAGFDVLYIRAATPSTCSTRCAVVTPTGSSRTL